jgi:hypothetical protein
MAQKLPIKPWHALAAGGALLGLGLLAGGGRRAMRFRGRAEDYAPLEDESACDPTPKPGVEIFRDWTLEAYGGSDLGIVRPCGGGRSGHYSGRAWDWGVQAGDPRADRFFSRIFANQHEILRRAGITYLIHDGSIWSTGTRQWRPYSGPNRHTDHVHVSFGTPGAIARTTFYQRLKA